MDQQRFTKLKWAVVPIRLGIFGGIIYFSASLIFPYANYFSSFSQEWWDSYETNFESPSRIVLTTSRSQIVKDNLEVARDWLVNQSYVERLEPRNQLANSLRAEIKALDTVLEQIDFAEQTLSEEDKKLIQFLIDRVDIKVYALELAQQFVTLTASMIFLAVIVLLCLIDILMLERLETVGILTEKQSEELALTYWWGLYLNLFLR